MTIKLNKNLPNIWKCSQNCSQSIKAQIEGTRHLHLTAFNVKNEYNKPCFETAYLAENVKNAQVQNSQTAEFHPIWSHCSAASKNIICSKVMKLVYFDI